MTILANIKAEQLRARKDRDSIKATLLTTLIGDAVMVGKNDGNRESTDAEVVGVIKKFVANTTEVLGFLDGDPKIKPSEIDKLKTEITILKSFLPQQLSETELSDVIGQIIETTDASSIKDMGKVMKALKEQHSGKYDGAQANALIKARFA